MEMREIYTHNLMESSMVCGHLRRLPLLINMLNLLPPLGLPTTPIEIAKSNPSNTHLQTNALSPPQSQPMSPSHLYGDHTHHIKYLEQLLDSSLVTAAVIRFSGNTLADVLTPRAYDTVKTLYALAALDEAASSTKPRWSDIPNRSIFSNIGNGCPYLSSPSPPLLNSNLGVHPPGRIHISISVDHVGLFLWAVLAAVSFLVLFSIFPRLCDLF